MENESRDLALIAWREDGRWRVSKLPTGATNDIGLVLDALRAQQNNGGALDEKLNELGYIVPGLGDAGDRLYGVV